MNIQGSCLFGATHLDDIWKLLCMWSLRKQAQSSNILIKFNRVLREMKLLSWHSLVVQWLMILLKKTQVIWL